MRWLPALVLVTACGGPDDPSEPGGPLAPAAGRDVVLVVIDTLRADRLAPYGHERDPAPFLTGLAERATVCDAAYGSST